mmetsp:Transcript_3265/g.9622  ORF Transcript_3265/g.9622 Transcript_3265/m.9622 type:complete len:150 (+) Transcript_3265:3-452(+)
MQEEMQRQLSAAARDEQDSLAANDRAEADFVLNMPMGGMHSPKQKSKQSPRPLTPSADPVKRKSVAGPAALDIGPPAAGHALQTHSKVRRSFLAGKPYWKRREFLLLVVYMGVVHVLLMGSYWRCRPPMPAAGDPDAALLGLGPDAAAP